MEKTDLQGDFGATQEQACRLSPVHTVFSTTSSRYQRWQAELLAYSHRKVRQPGGLTRLLSSDAAPEPFPGYTALAEPFSPHPFTGDEYTPYNKPAAIATWLREACPFEETILVLDPDCVFLSPLAINARPGRPIGQPLWWMEATQEPEVARRHCRRPALLDPVGVPILIHVDDLAAIAPLWLSKTEAIREDPVARKKIPWVAEMWGYTCAAAELGLRHELRDMQALNTANRINLPIVHYAYKIEREASESSESWTWTKWTYQPWDNIPLPPPGTPAATVALVDLINEWASLNPYCLE